MLQRLGADMKRRTVRAPGRVNLIGDHTDYTGGLALPAALPWATTVTWEEVQDRVTVESVFNGVDHKASIGLNESASNAPSWLIIAQFLARAAGTGGHFTVTSDLPVGAGLSSSAAYTVAVALALGSTGDPWLIAKHCQEAEAEAGSNVGLLDQMASLTGQCGKAVLLDFTKELFEPVELPEGTELVIVDSTQRRSLANSAYSERRRDCEVIEQELGPLASASLNLVEELHDPPLRRRAHHVISENLRVRAAVESARRGDPVGFGQAMNESHRSLAEDFDVSTSTLNDLSAALRSMPGIFGARMTGGGFGGCVVALTETGVGATINLGLPTWVVVPGDGAQVLETE